MLLLGLFVWGAVVSGMVLIHSEIRNWQERREAKE